MLYAHFIVDLPKIEAGYPKDTSAIIEWLQSFGWDIKNPEKMAAIKAEIDALPKNSRETLDDVFFFGMFDDYQALTVSGINRSQIIFRIYQGDIRKLHNSVEKIVKSVTSKKLYEENVKITDNQVIIYYSSQNTLEVTMSGQVIKNELQETFRKNTKDLYLFIFSFVLILTGISSSAIPNNVKTDVQTSLLDEIFLIGLTTAVVSFIGMLQAYLETHSQIKHDHIISWTYEYEWKNKD